MAGGVITHIVKSVVDKDELTPEMMIEEAKESLPLKKTVEEVKEGKGKEVLEGR